MSTSVATAPPPPRLSPLERRLWKGAGLMAMLVAVFLLMNTVLPPAQQLRAKDVGHDFLAFYTAGTFAREGNFAAMYDLRAVRDYQLEVTRQIGVAFGPGFMPWWNPPFAALPVMPLTLLPYAQATAIWIGINVLCVALAAGLLSRLVQQAMPDARRWTLVPVGIGLSVPFLLAVTHGQNTGISLLLLSIVVTLWRARRAFLAGVVCGLLCYKPQLAALVATALIVRLGWRAAAGVACSGVALLAITLVAMPGALLAFLRHMPANLTWFQEANAYYWERHVTFKALWRLLIQGHELGPTSTPVVVLWALCAGAVAIALLLVLRRGPARLPFAISPSMFIDAQRYREDRAIAATVACSPLLMPFYFDYDLLLMAVPIVLLAIERYRSDATAGVLDRWEPLAWSALLIAMLAQPHVAERTGVNVTAIVLTACATLTITRGLRRDDVSVAPVGVPRPLRVAA